MTLLLGSWKFIGSTIKDISNNPLPDPVNSASGLIIYNNEYMAVQFSFPKDDALTKESRLQTTHLAYAGKYIFDEQSHIVTHQVMFASVPSMVGQLLKRKVTKTSKNKMSLANIEPEQYAMEISVYRELFWEKAK